MQVGISTACYYPMEVDAALRQVVLGGAPCAEIFINSFSEMQPAFVRELRAILSQGDTTVTSIHPFSSAWEPMLFFGDYPRRFDDGLELYARYCEMTAELGARYVVLHGAFDRLSVSIERYLDSYGRLHELAKTFGIKFAQENVGRCMSRDPALLLALRQAIPDVAFVLDVKQTFRGLGGLDAVMDAMGDRIAHLHYSDAAPEQDCLPVGEGCFDFVHLFTRLQAIDYAGDAVLELYGDNYQSEEQLWLSVDRFKAAASPSLLTETTFLAK